MPAPLLELSASSLLLANERITTPVIGLSKACLKRVGVTALRFDLHSHYIHTGFTLSCMLGPLQYFGMHTAQHDQTHESITAAANQNDKMRICESHGPIHVMTINVL